MTTLLAAALAGFASLALEILGVRWLAPWFGTTSLVWSNQIGVVLLAMALGATLGGRLARRGASPLRWAAGLLGGAGLLLGLGIVLLPAFCAWLLPPGLRLEEAAGIALGGSLAGALLFFAPPVLLLSMVAPLLVEIRAAERGAGRAAGEVSAAGTLGSLLGVFGSTYLALPFLGIRLTLALLAACLILAGSLLSSRRRRLGALALLPLLPLASGDPAMAANLPQLEGLETRVLEVLETPYQRLRVVGFSAPGNLAPAERWLQMNEGVDSYQSRWQPGQVWPGGYYDLFVLAPLYALHGAEAQAPVHFWSLGHAGGAALGPVAAGLGDRQWSAVGVELDAGALELCGRWMPSPEQAAARTELRLGDARLLLRGAPEDLDFLLLDAYSAQFEIPAHLATAEFFSETRQHLRTGGVLAVNLGASSEAGTAGGAVGGIIAGLRLAYEDRVRLHQVPFSRNVLVFARKDLPLPPLEELWAAMPDDVPRLVGGAAMPGQVREGDDLPTGTPFRDDLNAIAVVQAREWVAEAGR
ncbi:MAG: fused MFS/spermidine synthase [Planctomycetes bacterium]|nr:fused MFS/spermidine synthase [Planctomycetota bacterium]MBL7008806.1 fused MFS/spermidine synthase [Planctomycetota bacterium]